jgi:hypothetical protein
MVKPGGTFINVLSRTGTAGQQWLVFKGFVESGRRKQDSADRSRERRLSALMACAAVWITSTAAEKAVAATTAAVQSVT